MLYNLKSILQGATCMYSISVNKTLIYSKKLGHIVKIIDTPKIATTIRALRLWQLFFHILFYFVCNIASTRPKP